MKTTAFCVILCLGLASSFPFPEPFPSYYGPYEPVGVPEQRIIPQPIQIARSQNSELSYQQKQLAYLQRENRRRQNYEALLRNREQQELNQRLADQLLIRTQPERSYNNPIPLNTVREPYIRSIPLQRSNKQLQYEAPIEQQLFQNQQISEPFQSVHGPQQFNAPIPEPQPIVEPSPAQSNYLYNHPVQRYNAQNVLYNPRIQQALASSPLKKRYLVLHPNGTIEHIDKIEHIVERHPNYILVSAADLSRAKQQPAAPVAPIAPGPVASTLPVPPVAPLTPVIPPAPPSPVVPSNSNAPSPPLPVSTTPAPPGALPPSIILNGTVPGPKTTVQPTGPTTPSTSVTAQTPILPVTTTPLPPTPTPPSVVTATATAVYPPLEDPTSTTPETPAVTTTEPPVTSPSVVTATDTAVYPPLEDPTSTTPETPAVTTTEPPVTSPSVVTATDTAVYPPLEDPTSTTPETSAVTTTEPPVTPPSVVTATANAVYPPIGDPTSTTPAPPAVTTVEPTVTPPSVVTATATAVYPPPCDSTLTTTTPTPAPVGNATAIVAVDNQSGIVENATVSNQTASTTLDFPFVKPPTDPIVWFRTKDLNFLDKLTSGNETFDVLYFFNVPREPRVTQDTRTVIYSNGTVVEDVIRTIYEDEDAPPRIVKTTKITNPDTQPNT